MRAKYITKSYSVPLDHRIASKSYCTSIISILFSPLRGELERGSRPSIIFKNCFLTLTKSYMKKIIFLFFTFHFSLLSLHAQPVTQEWVRRYDDTAHLNDYTGGIALDRSGNIYVTGWSQFSPNNSIITIKYNSSGVQQWLANYQVNGGVQVSRMVSDASSNMYVTGIYGDFFNGLLNIFLLKYDSNGIFKWFKSYGDTTHTYSAYDEIIDKQGNIYVIGSGILILKYSPNGDTIWTRNYQQQGYAHNDAYSIAVDSSNNIIIAGDCNIQPGYTVGDCLVLKYTASGNFSWATVYNTGGYNTNDFFYKVGVDRNGFIYATGKGGVNGDYLTIKYNSAGIQQWLRRYDGPGNGINGATSLAIDNQGSIYVTGVCAGVVSNEDIGTVKYSPNGDSIWVNRYDNPSHLNDEGYDIKLDSLGDVYINGLSSYNGYKITTIKYDNISGSQKWIMQYSGKPKWLETSLVVDNLFNIYAIGDNSDNGNGSDFITIKYNQPVGIISNNNKVPIQYKLFQNYPNPFNPATVIKYSLPRNGMISLNVYDILGREVEVMVNDYKTAGNYEVLFDGSKLASGIYIYKLITSDFIAVKKMVLVK